MTHHRLVKPNFPFAPPPSLRTAFYNAHLRHVTSKVDIHYLKLEQLIDLMESVAAALGRGEDVLEPLLNMCFNLRIHGPHLEPIAKDTLDRCFVKFRNASQDERLSISLRLHLLELIETRAKSWTIVEQPYYKAKQQQQQQQHQQQAAIAGELNDEQQIDASAAYLGTSPQYLGAAEALNSTIGSAHQQQALLGPGEVIKNSGKFLKPTKIPGKTYSKDEVVIRNADSGKVMGIKGRRVHMIEELSETVISFQRVSPGAKERLVQITGPTEDSINKAKRLIEDTIRRNASPVPLDAGVGGGAHGGGSCSSLNSSASDEAATNSRASIGGSGGGGGGSNLANRLNFNANNYNYLNAQASGANAAQVTNLTLNANALPIGNLNLMGVSALQSTGLQSANANAPAIRSNQQNLLHSFSTNDASLGEYKFTVNVGQYMLKLTGDCYDLVRVAKLVLDDYFSSAEFLQAVDTGAAFDGGLVSPTTPSGLMGPPKFPIGNAPVLSSPPSLVDNTLGFNYPPEGTLPNDIAGGEDDEVFVVDKSSNASGSSGGNRTNNLVRSRRSHFSRHEPEGYAEVETVVAEPIEETYEKIVYAYDHLLYYAKSLHSWALPADWDRIVDKFDILVRNKDLQDESNRFDGEAFLLRVRTEGMRNFADDDTNNDDDTQDNE